MSCYVWHKGIGRGYFGSSGFQGGASFCHIPLMLDQFRNRGIFRPGGRLPRAIPDQFLWWLTDTLSCLGSPWHLGVPLL